MKSQHGGKRPGAGKPRIKKLRYTNIVTIKAPPATINAFRTYCGPLTMGQGLERLLASQQQVLAP